MIRHYMVTCYAYLFFPLRPRVSLYKQDPRTIYTWLICSVIQCTKSQKTSIFDRQEKTQNYCHGCILRHRRCFWDLGIPWFPCYSFPWGCSRSQHLLFGYFSNTREKSLIRLFKSLGRRKIACSRVVEENL